MPEPPAPLRVTAEGPKSSLRENPAPPAATADLPTRAQEESSALYSATRQGAEVEAVARPPVTRDHDAVTVTQLSQRLLSEIARDPFAIACAVLAVAYLVQAVMVKAPKAGDAGESEARPRRSSKVSKSQFAISLNQKIMRLNNVDEVLEFAIAHTVVGKTDIVNVVTAIHRSAKLASGGSRKRIARDPRVRQLLDTLHGFLEDRPPLAILSRAVGNTSWALAKLQFPDDEHPILGALEAAFVENAKGFKPEELMNTVWAFAELRGEGSKKECQGRALNVARAAVACTDKFPDFTLQQVVYFAWALARLAQIAAVRNSPEIRAGLLQLQGFIFDRVRTDVHLLNTKNLAMVCWAVAHVHSKVGGSKEQVQTLLRHVSAHVVETRKLEQFFPGEIASILWALNKVQVDYPSFFHAFQQHLARHGLQGYNSQDLANITCAFVNTKTGDDQTYLALAAAANARAASFNRAERMMMHWAFGQLPHLPAPRLAGT